MPILYSFAKKAKQNNWNKDENSVASAAPNIPYLGIRKIFKIRFMKKEIIVEKATKFVFFKICKYVIYGINNA